MNELLDLGRRILAAQPFSVSIDAQLTQFQPELAELTIPITDTLKQQHGFVHGGVISYAADNALTFAAGSVLGADVVTQEFKINYVLPAVGDTLIARANVVYAGTRQAVCRCDIFTRSNDDDETLCAAAQGTILKKVVSEQ